MEIHEIYAAAIAVVGFLILFWWSIFPFLSDEKAIRHCPECWSALTEHQWCPQCKKKL